MKIIMVFALLSVCALVSFAGAKRCRNCSGTVLDSDRFCTACGCDLSARPVKHAQPLPYSLAAPARKDTIVREYGRKPVPVVKSREYSADKLHPFTDHGAPDITTPLKFTVSHSLALPWGMNSAVFGVNTGVIASYNHTIGGISVSLFSTVRHLYGLDVAFFSIADDVYGFQVGFMCVANELNGVQIGIINMAGKDTCGLQIGAINMIGTVSDNITIPVINMRF